MTGADRNTNALIWVNWCAASMRSVSDNLRNVVVLDPQVAKVFPNDEAVNDALRELIGLPTSSTRSRSKRKSKATEKKRVAL